jgi:hypothetical protein
MHNSTTINQYEKIVKNCKDIFMKKNCDYGASWYVLRLTSITDQINIKARRIRSIQEKKQQLVPDSIENELVGIINYSIMALMKYEFYEMLDKEPSLEELSNIYEKIIDTNKHLLKSKNHDYEEAWRHMRLESILDIILMKLLRIKRIEDNKNEVSISEGVDANYRDIINYTVFYMIKLQEQ